MNYTKGDLIDLALEGKFDVITHGCNCFCKMGSGIAVPMKKAFQCDLFLEEHPGRSGDYNKLGTIDYKKKYIKDGQVWKFPPGSFGEGFELYVVNSYTQFQPGKPTPPYNIPLDYDALAMCFRKINHQFKGLHLGIPQIGCGLAGGDWDEVEEIIDMETPDMEVTCVIYDK